MLGLLAVYAVLALHVLVLALVGRHDHGSFAAWWRA